MSDTAFAMGDYVEVTQGMYTGLTGIITAIVKGEATTCYRITKLNPGDPVVAACSFPESSLKIIGKVHPEKQLTGLDMHMASPFQQRVMQELASARLKHRPMNSLHEAYAVMLEELDELWDEIKRQNKERNPDRLRDELVQIAAMCQRTAEDMKLV